MADDFERIDGPTPAGGSYAVVWFLDESGSPCEKKHAEHVQIEEYDEDHHSIARTYMDRRDLRESSDSRIDYAAGPFAAYDPAKAARRAVDAARRRDT